MAFRARVLSPCLVLLVWCAAPVLGEVAGGATPNGLEVSVRISLAGDSITAGRIQEAGLPEDAPVCVFDLCFAALLRAKVAAASDEGRLPPARVDNLGVGGATSRDWDPNDSRGVPLFDRIPASNVVMLYVGTNDAVGLLEADDAIPVEEYEAHLHDFAATLLVRGVDHVVLVTPPIPVHWLAAPQRRERMRQYAEAARRVCHELPLRYRDCLLDLQETFPARTWRYGAIHPSIEGHAAIADLYMEHLERMVRRFDGRRSTGWGSLSRLRRYLSAVWR